MDILVTKGEKFFDPQEGERKMKAEQDEKEKEKEKEAKEDGEDKAEDEEDDEEAEDDTAIPETEVRNKNSSFPSTRISF